MALKMDGRLHRQALKVLLCVSTAVVLGAIFRTLKPADALLLPLAVGLGSALGRASGLRQGKDAFVLLARRDEAIRGLGWQLGWIAVFVTTVWAL